MKEIKVVVIYTDGYQKRYTAACLEVIRKRELLDRESQGVLDIKEGEVS